MTSLLTICHGAQDVANVARDIYAMELATKRTRDRFALEAINERRQELVSNLRALAADMGFDIVPARAVAVREAAE